MAIEGRNRPLPDWFTRLRTHQTVLPRFQRFEAWSHDNVTDVFNTILQDLPIGAVLVLNVGDREPFISRALEGTPQTGERVTEHLLDGQQRLSALWRGLHNNYEDRTYFLYLMPDEDTATPYYVDSIARWRKEGDKQPRPFWANTPSGQWERRMVPLDLCAPDIEAQQRFRAWAKQAISDANERDKVSDIVAIVRQKFFGFNLPFLSLPVTTSKQTALDVFIKMNTSAAPLSTYDIVVAQVEEAMGSSLHDLVAETRATCPAISAYYAPEELALYAGALLQDRPPTNATYLSDEFGPLLLRNWAKFLRGVGRAAQFLEEERIFDSTRLPSDVVIPVLVALWADAPDGLDGEGRARLLLRKYIWRAFFSDRYEKSTNSRSLVDFTDLRPLVTGSGTSEPVILNDSKHPLPHREELVLAGWPTKKDRLARAILAIALKRGGLDLADGSQVTRANLAKREYHHLFPDAHLQRLNVPQDKIYVSLNCALVTWRTNRNIGDKEPERYLAERQIAVPGQLPISENELKARLESHLIPYAEMVAGDYERFLEKRASLIHEEMMKLCEPDAAADRAPSIAAQVSP